MGLGGQCHAPATTHGGDQVPIVQEAGWAPAWVAANFYTTGVGTPNLQPLAF